MAVSVRSHSVDALEIVTLVVAIVGAVTGVAALVWQAVSFVLSGSRPKLRVERRKHGYITTVVNKGRSPLVVRSVGFRLPGNRDLRYGDDGQRSLAHGAGPEFPWTIGPGDHETAHIFPDSDLYDAGYAEGEVVRIRPFVLLGTLKRKTLRRRKLRFTTHQGVHLNSGQPVPRNPIEWD